MTEQDLKYLIASYQQKSFDLLSQSIASDAKVKQLSELVEVLTTKINEQNEEIEKLKPKTKRTTKPETTNFQ
jgi:predicted RNase H-like nuclease (RuvC/YqgF family)